MILTDIQKDLYAAQKEKDTLKVSVLRYLISKIKNEQIDLKAKGGELTDADVIDVIRKQVKSRNKSIESFVEAGRDDLVEKETEELEVLENVLEKYSSEEE